jgi:hypothetical protein
MYTGGAWSVHARDVSKNVFIYVKIIIRIDVSIKRILTIDMFLEANLFVLYIITAKAKVTICVNHLENFHVI